MRPCIATSSSRQTVRSYPKVSAVVRVERASPLRRQRSGGSARLGHGAYPVTGRYSLGHHSAPLGCCLCPFAWGGTERIFIDAHRGMLMQRASCEEAPQKTHAAWVECDIREQRQSEGQCRTEKQTVSFLGLC